MLTKLDKKQIVSLIDEEKNRLGSYRKVANRCGVSAGTISQMANEKWELIKDELWLKVGKYLGHANTGWQIAETTNYRMIKTVLDDARAESMFMAISHKAGSGKTATINHYRAVNANEAVFVIQAREWAKREFLLNLCQVLGIDVGKGYVTVDKLGQKVIKFFNDRQTAKPLLIVDECDKLKPSALRYLIPLYNELEDKVGVVISGTDNLEKEIKKGVQYNRKGFDELDSRFGRNFIHLVGATYKDVQAVCEANGITDNEKQKIIFEDSEPTRINYRDRYIKVVEDLRRVKRAIKREVLRKNREAA